jgi:hypothetical protein
MWLEHHETHHYLWKQSQFLNSTSQPINLIIGHEKNISFSKISKAYHSWSEPTIKDYRLFSFQNVCFVSIKKYNVILKNICNFYKLTSEEDLSAYYLWILNTPFFPHALFFGSTGVWTQVFTCYAGALSLEPVLLILFLIILKTGSHFLPMPPQLLVEMESHKLTIQAGLEPYPPHLSLPSS